MQAFTLPVLAIAFAAAPLAGQNFGARNVARVRETFWVAAAMSCACMLAAMFLCQWRPEKLIEVFTGDAAVIGVGATYLRIGSWNFVASGIIFTCSSLFQAIGNTWPSLLSSAFRLITFVLPAVWLSLQASFQLRQLWYLSVCSVALQALTSIVLLQVQFHRRLGLELETSRQVRTAS
jgi:Na+-driven multidrug efflux pump